MDYDLSTQSYFFLLEWCKVWVSSCEARPKSKQEMANNFHDICTTLKWMGISCQAGHYCSLHSSQLDMTNDYFSSPANQMVLSSIIFQDSQYGWNLCVSNSLISYIQWLYYVVSSAIGSYHVALSGWATVVTIVYIPFGWSFSTLFSSLSHLNRLTPNYLPSTLYHVYVFASPCGPLLS